MKGLSLHSRNEERRRKLGKVVDKCFIHFATSENIMLRDHPHSKQTNRNASRKKEM